MRSYYIFAAAASLMTAGPVIAEADGNEATGARVYVALEALTGSLGGKQGSFIVTHRGTMTKDSQNLSIIIVPDSGTDELRGISGTMDIQNIDGKHSYTIDYTLPSD